MSHVRVWASIKADNTGRTRQLPVILISVDGKLKVLEPELRYLNTMANSRSHSWMIKLCQIIGLLIDFIDANHGIYDKPVTLFREFVSALYNGTIDENGEDPSCLYWLPSRSYTVNPKISMLGEFSQWMVNNGYASEALNPWTAATTTEQRFNYLAWCKKNDKSFLKHLGPSRLASASIEKALSIKLRRPLIPSVSTPKIFPVSFEVALLREGFTRPGKQNSKDPIDKYDWRGICISLLMLYGGRRLSEPFHLWMCDVIENPNAPEEAYVRIYHPIEGKAPKDKKLNGRYVETRQAYLQAFYPKYIPRNLGTGNYEAGFKSKYLVNDGMYMVIYWAPKEWGKVFLHAYQMYMWQRIKLGIDGSRHPFAFVSHSGASKGEPYTIKSFEAAWERAIKRIGLSKIKINGTSPHGARHGYAKRAKSGDVEPDALRIALAHSSIESQRIYGKPGIEEVSEMMNAASQRVERFDVSAIKDLYESQLEEKCDLPQSDPLTFDSIFIDALIDERNQHIRRRKRNG